MTRMLYRFEPGRRYLKLFPGTVLAALALTVIGAGTIGPGGTLWGFPLVMLWLAASQCRSGVALDGMWTARHPRGTPTFIGLMIWGFSLPIAWSAYAAWLVFAERKG